MEKIIPALRQAIREKKRDCAAEAERLSAESRSDEAALCKVRMNICDILRVLSEKAEADGGDFREAFAALCGHVSGPWAARLETAKAHGDFHAQAVEEAKLETLRSLTHVFTEAEA